MKNLLALPREVIRLWPDYLHGYQEMQEINRILALEFTNYTSRLQQVYENQFVYTANEDGIARFESELGIYPREDANLEDRRFEVLTKLRNRPPYTKRTLKLLLDSLLGIGMYDLKISTNNYMVSVAVELKRKNQVNALADLLRRVIPANMFFKIQIKYNQYYLLTKFTYAELKKYTYQDLRENPQIKEIYLDRGGILV